MDKIYKHTCDEDNPEYALQGINTRLLLAINSGQVDINLIAEKELANRGLNKKGTWIGFSSAKKEIGFTGHICPGCNSEGRETDGIVYSCPGCGGLFNTKAAPMTRDQAAKYVHTDTWHAGDQGEAEKSEDTMYFDFYIKYNGGEIGRIHGLVDRITRNLVQVG